MLYSNDEHYRQFVNLLADIIAGQMAGQTDGDLEPKPQVAPKAAQPACRRARSAGSPCPIVTHPVEPVKPTVRLVRPGDFRQRPPDPSGSICLN